MNTVLHGGEAILLDPCFCSCQLCNKVYTFNQGKVILKMCNIMRMPGVQWGILASHPLHTYPRF